MTFLSVLIVSYRTPRLTAAAVASALEVARVSEVVVVDNASGDETLDLIHALVTERVRVISNPTNAGYGAAANIAAAKAKGETLIFLNSDAELSTQAVEALAAEVDRHDGRCVVGSRLVGVDGVVQRSAGLLPGPVDLTVRALGLSAIAQRVMGWPPFGGLVRRSRFAREHASAVDASKPISTTMVSGACFGIGRRAFADLGGFDERFFLYFEDADLCRRARDAGMHIRYVPDAVVPHIGGASSAEDYHFGPHHARSMRQYLAKWYGPAGGALAVVILWLRAVGLSLSVRPGARRAWSALRAAAGSAGSP